MTAKNTAQGSLEYVIIIGGVIILAAATYFMLRGFSQTTGAGTTEQIGVAGEKYMLELENLGRSETRFSAKKWANPLLQKRTLMEFSLLGDVEFNTTNLTDHGILLSSLEFYFFDGSFHGLNYTVAGEILTVHTGSACCATDFDLYLFYNNATSLINPCLANYTGPTRTACGTIPLPDSSPPTVSISSTAYGSSGSVADADITVTVNGTGSNVSEVYYRIDDSPYFKADNLYYGYQDMSFEAHPADDAYDSEVETIHIIATVPVEDNYAVRVHARDEYGNEVTEEGNVSIEVAGGAGPGESEPVYFNVSLYLATAPLGGSGDDDVFSFLRNATTWVQHQNITEDGGAVGEQSSAIDFGYNDSAYSAVAVYDWYGGTNGINYSFFDSRTDQWSNPKTIAENDTSYYEIFDVAFDNDSNALLVWCEDGMGGRVLQSAFWNNTSKQWTNITIGYECGQAMLSVDFDSEGKAMVVWIAWVTGTYTLRYASFESGSWSAAQSIYPLSDLVDLSFVFNDSDDGILVFEEGSSSNMEIGYSFFDSGTETWSTPLNITDNSVRDSNPQIGLDKNGDPVAVWRSDPTGPGFGYLNYSIYTGGSWNSGTVGSDQDYVFPEIYQDFNNNIMAVGLYDGIEIRAWFWDGSSWSTYEVIGYAGYPP